MKALKLFLITLVQLNFFATANAQEPVCETCSLPPQAVGAGGVTCKSAEDAFLRGSSALDSYGFSGVTTRFVLKSEVYCRRNVGYGHGDSLGTSLTVRYAFDVNPLDLSLGEGYTASLESVMHISGLSVMDRPIVFEKNGDAVFKRDQYFYYPWSKQWMIPTPSLRFVNYQCRVAPENEMALVCKLTFDGRIEMGYQIFVIDSYDSGFPEGILR